MYSIELCLIDGLQFLNLVLQGFSLHQRIPLGHFFVLKLIHQFNDLFMGLRVIILLLFVSVNPTLSRRLLCLYDVLQ